MESRKPAVSCTQCERTWNSATMAEGLRLVGCCPRCKGVLEFADDAPMDAVRAEKTAESAAPHMVLGLPRLPY